MPDLNFQDISTVQSGLQPKPTRLACAATIAPSTFLTVLAGTTQIATITPPVTGSHMLCVIFSTTQSGQWATTGNVVSSTTTVASNIPQFLVFDPVQAKYFKE